MRSTFVSDPSTERYLISSVKPLPLAAAAWRKVISLRRVVFDSEAPSGANVLCNEVLALLDRLRPNLARDISVRAQIELRGSVIDIERIHPALSDGKGGSFAASGRPGDHDHPGLHSARRGKKAADSFLGRNVVSGSEFNRTALMEQ
jgi:hypothetical protein